MKIIVDTRSSLLILDAGNEKIGAILEALSTARMGCKTYESSRGYVYKYNDNGAEVDITMVPDGKLEPEEDIITQLRKDSDHHKDNWLREYNQRAAAEKEVKQLKAKLEAIGEKLGSVDKDLANEPETVIQ